MIRICTAPSTMAWRLFTHYCFQSSCQLRRQGRGGVTSQAEVEPGSAARTCSSVLFLPLTLPTSLEAGTSLSTPLSSLLYSLSLQGMGRLRPWPGSHQAQLNPSA